MLTAQADHKLRTKVAVTGINLGLEIKNRNLWFRCRPPCMWDAPWLPPYSQPWCASPQALAAYNKMITALLRIMRFGAGSPSTEANVNSTPYAKYWDPGIRAGKSLKNWYRYPEHGTVGT